jgi:hypothetical protein
MHDILRCCLIYSIVLKFDGKEGTGGEIEAFVFGALGAGGGEGGGAVAAGTGGRRVVGAVLERHIAEKEGAIEVHVQELLVVHHPHLCSIPRFPNEPAPQKNEIDAIGT